MGPGEGLDGFVIGNESGLGEVLHKGVEQVGEGEGGEVLCGCGRRCEFLGWGWDGNAGRCTVVDRLFRNELLFIQR